MTEPRWEDVLRLTSGKEPRTYSARQTFVKEGRDIVVAGLGSLPIPKLPAKTRFRWLKELVLRALRVYSRGQLEVTRWIYDRIDEDRNALRNLGDIVADVRRDHSQSLTSLNTNVEQLREVVESYRADAVLHRNELNELKEILNSMEISGEERSRTELECNSSGFSNDFLEGIHSTLRHDGIFGEQNLWFNPPVVIEVKKGIPEINQVNERIFEPVEAIAALRMSAQPGSKVLDIGSAESLVPFQYATLGYETTSIDVRRYPLTHPNLTTITGDFFEVALANSTYQFISCISVIEHFGLGWYSDPKLEEDADFRGLKKMSDLLTTDGVLFLTTPFSDEYRVTGFERTYSEDRLNAMLRTAGLRAIDFSVYVRQGNSIWNLRQTHSDIHNKHAVAVIRALKG